MFSRKNFNRKREETARVFFCFFFLVMSANFQKASREDCVRQREYIDGPEALDVHR